MKGSYISGFAAFALLLALPALPAFGGGRQSGALGGSFASRGMARPLGGIGAGPRTFNRGPRYFAPPVLPYAYSWYVPNYFDYLDSDWSSGYSPYPAYPPPAAYPSAATAPAAPPVVINQFFGGAAGPPQQMQAPPEAPTGESAASGQPGDPIGPVENYYLIAYKNHQIYAALAYWVEDSTLHYVTTENTHNQASLDLIDLNLTKTLNQARNVPFSIQGR